MTDRHRNAVPPATPLLLGLTLWAGALWVGSAVAEPSRPQPLPAQQESESEAEQRIQQGLQAILEGLSLFMRDIPRYEAPEILPNGDIIIRRVNPEDSPGWKEDDDETVPAERTEGKPI